MLSGSSLFTPVTDEWFHRTEIKKGSRADNRKAMMTMMKNVISPGTRFLCTFHNSVHVCVCVRYIASMFEFRHQKKHEILFCAFPIASGFFHSLAYSFVAALVFVAVVQCTHIPLNQFNRNVNLFVKKHRKFFDIKVRMLHMYACASPSISILLIICCCSLLKLFPVPLFPSFFSFIPSLLFFVLSVQFMKWNEIKLKLIKSNKRSFFSFVVVKEKFIVVSSLVLQVASLIQVLAQLKHVQERTVDDGRRYETLKCVPRISFFTAKATATTATATASIKFNKEIDNNRILWCGVCFEMMVLTPSHW